MADEQEVAAEVTPETPAAEAPAVEAPAAEAPAAPAEAPEKSAKVSRREGLASIYADKFKGDEGKDDRTPAEKTRDAKGQFAKGAEKPLEKPAEKPPEKPTEGQEAKPPEKPAEKPVAKKPGLKAPQSWSKEQRKSWDAIPDEAKAVIVKRENELNAAGQRIEQQWKPVRDFGQAFAKVIMPFKSMMEQEAAAAGQPYNPLRTIQNLFQTVAMLRHPDKRVGAGALAHAMQAYGISGEQIADALEGKGLKPGEQPAQQAPQAPQLDPDKLLEQAEQRVMQRFQAQQQAAYEAEAAEEAASFAESHPHFEEVKDRMADLIELNARRMAALPPGQRIALSFDEAYRIACLSDPELAPSVQAAEAPAPAAAVKPAVKPVASSIRGKPGGPSRPAASKPKTRLEGLSQLWNAKFSPQP